MTDETIHATQEIEHRIPAPGANLAAGLFVLEPSMDLRVVNVIADWADQRKVDTSFSRNERGSWLVTVHFKDHLGAFSATGFVPIIDTARQKQLAQVAEHLVADVVEDGGDLTAPVISEDVIEYDIPTISAFERTIRNHMSGLCVKAHKARFGTKIAA